MKAVLFVLVALAAHVLAKGSVSKSKALEMEASKQIQGRFDWNHQTVGQMMPVAKPFGGSQIRAPRATWRGVTGLVTDALTVFPGGHNFATRRAVDYAVAKAQNTPAMANLLKVMKVPTVADLMKDKDDQAFSVYSLLYGNFQNELRVNLDGDVGIYAAAAAGIRLRFGGDKEISPNGKNSKWYTPETGYSSANPIHSMLASSSNEEKNRNTWTQEKSLQTLKEFVTQSLTEAITLLRAEKAREAAEAAKPKPSILGAIGNSISNGLSTLGSYAKGEGGYALGWGKGLRLIGSVLHTVQDSACGCTPKHWTIPSTADCLAGDGHGVIEYFPAERMYKVTGLSDAVFYKERLHFHEELDKLYEEGRVLPVATLVASTNEQIDAITTANNLFGSFDPAIAGGKILLDVVAAVVDTTSTPDVAAAKIMREHVASRYHSKLVMPSIQDSTCEKEIALKKNPRSPKCVTYKSVSKAAVTQLLHNVKMQGALNQVKAKKP